MEFALSQAVASGDTFEHRPSECGHCVQDFLADLDLRDLPGEAAGSESGADDTLPTADLRFYPAALVVPCGHLPGHAAVAADLGNMAIPNGWIPRRLRSGQLRDLSLGPMTPFQRPICVSIRLRWLYPVATCQAMRPLLRIWAIWRSRTVGSRADCGRVTAFFGGGITTSRVSPYRCLSISRVDAPS